MSLSLEQFISQLDESGVISAVDIAAFQKSQSPAAKSAEDLGKLLVKYKKLTKLQAQMVFQGKGQQLKLGNYLIQDKIGSGGMGDVYLAKHSRMNRSVALKVLPSTMAEDENTIRRFQREVQAAAKLSHPNIVTAHDADEAKGIHYLVMEHVDGIDLSAIVKKQGVLSVEKALGCILQAAKGLEYAHNKGVIHRDIKPSNLLLDHDGTVKILDMGLARIDDVDDENPVTALTQSGSVMGTVDYMSPEQAQSTHTADARSDIYSLGCSLYYLLTGESVYRGSTMVNRIMAHQNDPIPSLTGKHILISQDVDAVFQKMVAKKPEDRFQSMSEVIVAIDNCIQMKSSSTVSTEPSDPELHKFLQSQRMASSPTIVMSADAMTAEKPLTDTQNESLTSVFFNHTLGGTSYQPLAKRKKSIGKRGWVLMGAVLVPLIFIAGIVFKIDIPAGTIILEVDQPELAGAVVSIDEQKNITIKTGEGQEPIEVVADEKTHTLQVTKGGFETFTKQFTVKAGGKETIKVRLLPVKPQIAEAKPVPQSGYILPKEQPAPAIVPFTAEQAKQYQEVWAKYLGVEVETTNSIGIKMRVIPPGEFLMGSSEEEIAKLVEEVKEQKSPDTYFQRVRSEGPQHKVTLTKPFGLAAHEVTRGQFRQFVEATGYKTDAEKTGEGGKGYKNGEDIYAPEFLWNTNLGFETEQSDDHPVVNVSWNDAVAFCNWLSKKESVTYRLPTEAEWEYACRAGSEARFSFGDDDSKLGDYAWYGMQGGRNTMPVGKKAANALGLFDLYGNVWEWCGDRIGPYGSGPAVDPLGSKDRDHRLLRGGAFNDQPSTIHSAIRSSFEPTKRIFVFGFRIARSFEMPKPTASEKANYALRFQNNSDHVTLPLKHETAGDLTVEAWVTIDEYTLKPQNFIAIQSSMISFFLGNSAQQGKEMQWNTTVMNDGQFYKLKANSQVEFGKRTNIVVTYKGNVAQIYVNGHKKGEMNFKRSELRNGYITTIGWKDTLNFKGSIDEVRFSNVARYTEDFTPDNHFENDEHTMALYHFDKGSGDVLKDSSGNGHDGKIVGAKWVKVDDELQVIEPTTTGEKPMTDREIAEWVIGLGGVIGINDKTLYSKIEELPSGPVKFTVVKLKAASFETNDLKRLAKLENLLTLDLASTSIRDSQLQYLKDMQKLASLNLSNTKISDEGLVHLSNLKNLQYLALEYTKLTGEGLGHLKDLPRLTILFVPKAAITNSGMKVIGDLKQLTALNIASNSQIDDTGVGYLEGLTKLEGLKAYHINKITDEGLKYLKGLRNLKRISVGSLGITDAGLEQLAEHENLTELEVTNSKITDSGLEHLKNLKNLNTLAIQNTPITDDGLQHLHGLKKLESLELRETKVTPQGIANLQKALPTCKIVSDSFTISIPDRRAAEWVVSIGGIVEVLVNNEKVTANRLEDLPKKPFFVHMIILHNNEKVTDDGLRVLTDLTQLSKFYATAIPITNEGMQHFAKLTSLTELDISYTTVGDDGLHYLGKLEKLIFLNLHRTNITDVGIMHLANLRNLLKLNLYETETGDKGLEHIKNLIKMQHLAGGKLTTDDGIKHLNQMKQLQRLEFDGTQVTGSGLVHLVDLENLLHLNLQGSPVSNSSLQNVSKYTNLQELNLRSTNITDACLKYLEPLKQLKTLTLHRTNIADSGFKHLHDLKNLEHLNLLETKVTPQGIAELQNALPNCKIESDFETKPPASKTP